MEIKDYVYDPRAPSKANDGDMLLVPSQPCSSCAGAGPRPSTTSSEPIRAPCRMHYSCWLLPPIPPFVSTWSRCTWAGAHAHCQLHFVLGIIAHALAAWQGSNCLIAARVHATLRPNLRNRWLLAVLTYLTCCRTPWLGQPDTHDVPAMIEWEPRRMAGPGPAQWREVRSTSWAG